MEEVFENEILDDLYETRGEKFESIFNGEYDKIEEIRNAKLSEKELTRTIKELIQDEEKQRQILEKLNNFEGRSAEERNFWNKQYYKLGFADGMQFKEEIRPKMKDKGENYNLNLSDSNLYDYIEDYIESQRMKHLRERSEYKKKTDEIKNLKEEYPKVRSFIEDEEITELSNEELKAVLKIMNLNDSIEVFEIEETFKMAIKLGISL